MFPTNQDTVELIAWRRKLHASPELSGEEEATASAVRAFLDATAPDRIVTGIGGHGVAVVYDGAEPGPTVLFRAELDALPIEELTDVHYRSTQPGKGHLCGHDGHTTILAALGIGLGRRRTKRGRAVLMFQPAEETGAGAAAVVADPKFAGIAPDYAFALHNFPGIALGEAALRAGPAACASCGMKIVLTGKTAHASMPETGVSPMRAVAALMPALTALGHGDATSRDFALVTVTHAEMGAPAFGVAPGQAEIWVTLRTLVDDRMDALRQTAEALVKTEASASELGCEITFHEEFRHCENDREATDLLRAALDAEGVPHGEAGQPMRASEDFGRFGDSAKSAMFLLGAGVEHPSLHNPDYDFPDDLIGIGARVFMRAARDLLG